MNEFERRIQQRFSLNFPIFIDGSPANGESSSFTRDVSARGVFFYTHADWLQPSAPISFSMILPAEITGSKAARVTCKGRVVRLEPRRHNGTTGVAATIESYDF